LLVCLSAVSVSSLAQAAVIENTLLYLLCLRVSSTGLIVRPPSEKRGSEGRKSGGRESHVRQLLILSVARLNNITRE